MRILILGAGAVGGYFGGRLLEAGRDVTFLVRPGRAAELARDGLVIKSAYGDVTLPNPAAVVAEDLNQTFDVVILSSKAYDLAGAIDSFAPAVGPETMILPLLNGMNHLEVLSARFGRERVLGGECKIAATLNEERAVVHLNQAHSISFGELDGGISRRIRALAAVMTDAGFDAQPSDMILQQMWEKWVFLATLAGATCLMRGSVGDILAAPAGDDFILALFEECRAIAEAEGYAPRPAFLSWSRPLLTAPGSTFTASMLRDLEAGARIEADHVLGDLLRRRNAADPELSGMSLLQIAYIHLKTYEGRRAR
jgi:2-dehydropantoate 2-reductase